MRSASVRGKLMFACAAAALALSGCDKDTKQDNAQQNAQAAAAATVTPPEAALPLAAGASPASAPAPVASALPQATPIRYDSGGSDRYVYLDRAYTAAQAFGDAPRITHTIMGSSSRWHGAAMMGMNASPSRWRMAACAIITISPALKNLIWSRIRTIHTPIAMASWSSCMTPTATLFQMISRGGKQTSLRGIWRARGRCMRHRFSSTTKLSRRRPGCNGRSGSIPTGSAGGSSRIKMPLGVPITMRICRTSRRTGRWSGIAARRKPAGLPSQSTTP